MYSTLFHLWPHRKRLGQIFFVMQFAGDAGRGNGMWALVFGIKCNWVTDTRARIRLDIAVSMLLRPGYEFHKRGTTLTPLSLMKSCVF